MTAAIGHNNGPTMEPGESWRRHVWTRARADLIPNTLPIEVIRMRVRRAEALGLPYRTYASIRASTGRDVIGFLFSTNALHLLRPGDAPPPDRHTRLTQIHGADRTALCQPPLTPHKVAQLPGLDAAHPAPSFHLSWPRMRDEIRSIIRARGLPADGLLVIGETAAERDWAEAGRTAGFLSGARFFGA